MLCSGKSGENPAQPPLPYLAFCHESGRWPWGRFFGQALLRQAYAETLLGKEKRRLIFLECLLGNRALSLGAPRKEASLPDTQRDLFRDFKLFCLVRKGFLF